MAALVALSATATQASRFVSASFQTAPSTSASSESSQIQSSFLQARSGLSITQRTLARPSRLATSRFATAALGSSPRMFMADENEDDVTKGLSDGADDNDDIVASSSEFLDTVNAVVADVVDGQRYLKETGRTSPRPMKRRALVVCLALGALRPYIGDVESRVANLRRTSSSSFARTCRLASQLSFGASRAGNFISDQRECSSDSGNDDDSETRSSTPSATSQ